MPSVCQSSFLIHLVGAHELEDRAAVLVQVVQVVMDDEFPTSRLPKALLCVLPCYFARATTKGGGINEPYFKPRLFGLAHKGSWSRRSL